MHLITGSHNDYEWLISDEQDICTLMRLCPNTVLGKYLAVRSRDCGSLILTDEEKSVGWESRRGIAYSPRIGFIDRLPHATRSRCMGFDEWYVFDKPVDLGEAFHGNMFEIALEPGQVAIFVTYGSSFALHDLEGHGLDKLFWKQLDWIKPVSYIADGAWLTFLSRDKTFSPPCVMLSQVGPNKT